jgi:hypothetical protein
MLAEDREELAREFEEFGFRETDDPDEADRHNYYKVERWDATEQHALLEHVLAKDLAADRLREGVAQQSRREGIARVGEGQPARWHVA